MDGLVFGLLLAGGLILLALLPCSSRGCRTERSLPRADARGASPVDELLATWESSRRQMRHRLDMLDEMIEKADREIDAMQRRLAAVRIPSTSRVDPDARRAMLNLLRAGGFSSGEIASLTGIPATEIGEEWDDGVDSRAA